MLNNNPHDVEPDRQDMEKDELGQEPTTDTHGENDIEQLKRRTPWDTLTARAISLVSRKGGVGKTTSAVNIGAALALADHSVLIVSVDPQCGIAPTLGYDRDELKGGLPDIFHNSISLTDMAHTTPLKNLFFVSPNIWSLDDEEAYLELMESDIDTFVSEVDRARNLYDTILIDCPPNLGAATRAALLASDSYLVPIQAEELCRDSLDRLLTFIQAFRDDAFAETVLSSDEGNTPPVGLEGMFLTMVSTRTRMSRHVMAKVNEDYPNILFESFIPRTTRLTEMALRGKPAVIYDRKSAGSRAYFNLADELLERFKKRNGDNTVEDWGSIENVTMLSSAEEQVSYPALENRELLDTESPELISLDEVLAEEELKAREEKNWEDPPWEAGDNHNRKMH